MASDRGHYRIYLGMAAGVGKTLRMLQEGHAELAAGRDVVVGLLETHGREGTAEWASGLEILPRRRVSYREQELEEMDLPGILTRHPELVLIDELAHTNVPGVEHAKRYEEMDLPGILTRHPELVLIDELAHANVPGVEHVKRYEDIEDVLAAGIDVLSTVNVQHLESLNDSVAELTGTRVRETVPDDCLARADEIVLIDVTPETLLDRLRSGQVYPAERIDTALNNFFRIENLSALREVALRQVAQEVEAKRIVTEVVGTREDRLADDAPQAVGERLLALVEPHPGTQRLVRHAWRSAQRLGAELDVLWVRGPGSIDQQSERSLAALRQLASVLGAHMLVEESDDVAAAVARVALERGTTYILMGSSRPARGLKRLRTPLPQRLVRQLPGVDVRIVAGRALRHEPKP